MAPVTTIAHWATRFATKIPRTAGVHLPDLDSGVIGAAVDIMKNTLRSQPTLSPPGVTPSESSGGRGERRWTPRRQELWQAVAAPPCWVSDL